MKKLITGIIITVFLMGMLPTVSFAKTTAVTSQESFQQALEDAQDGDIIQIFSSLSLTETIEIPAVKLTIQFVGTITSTADTMFKIANGAELSFYCMGTITPAANSTIFDNYGSLALLMPFGTLGAEGITIANNKESATMAIPSGGNYRGHILADSTATVTIAALGEPTFSPKPDNRFLASGHTFEDADNDGIYDIINHNIVEFQYRKSITLEQTEQYLSLQEAADREAYVIENNYYTVESQKIKHQLLLDYEGDVEYTEDITRYIYLNGQTVTGDIIVSDGVLIIDHGNSSAPVGTIDGDIRVKAAAALTVNAGVIKSITLESGASVTTAAGTVTNECDFDITIVIEIDDQGIVLTMPGKPDGLDYEVVNYKINGEDALYELNQEITLTEDISIAPVKKCKVTYIADGVEIQTIYVDIGANATAPQIPTKSGYDEVTPTWDNNGENITKNTVINAIYTKNEPGEYEETTPDTNVGNGGIEEDIDGLKNAVPFEDEELQEVENGKDVEIWLMLTDITDTVPPADKELVEEVIQDNAVAIYIDANLFKKIGENEPVKVTQLNKSITIKMIVPEEYRNSNKDITREFFIVRVHNGDAEILDTDYNPETHEISFTTDKFSTYALTYKDTSNIVSPETGDISNVGTWVTLNITSAMLLVFTAVISKKAYKKEA